MLVRLSQFMLMVQIVKQARSIDLNVSFELPL